ncbi:hypothetical protein [Flavobacterium caeni]|uniref:Uncharacterized protein n=1 Tax=Flavobacterium caeni TaxID=490189 RepID=A0A1G5KGN4_9FLAO|nr:hypothetical protein [Flavobacterium caeni]SCY99762.1 hypothetical protein SAMN02927903_03300 [Flavobacterium caeni]
MRNIIFFPIAILAFSILFLALMSQDFLTSIIPGWHTTIIPLYFIVIFTVVINLIFPWLIYSWLKKQNKTPNAKLFLCHILLSTIIILMMKFPLFLVSSENFQETMDKVMTVFKVLAIAFLLEQIIFLIYILKISRRTLKKAV